MVDSELVAQTHPLLDFFIGAAISTVLITATSLIAYEIMRWTWLWLNRLTVHRRTRTAALLVPIFICHFIAIWLYAFVIFFVGNYSKLGSLHGESIIVDHAPSFIESLHYSAMVYTTVGFGDIIPTGILQFLAGAEALNGLVMIGWSVSLSYLAMQKFWDMR